jgi:hypothetical protein
MHTSKTMLKPIPKPYDSETSFKSGATVISIKRGIALANLIKVPSQLALEDISMELGHGK